MAHSTSPHPPVAVVTGASAGLGLALTATLTSRGWHVIADARNATRLSDAIARFPRELITAVPGDVSDADHRAELAETARAKGGARLLVNNASELGPSPSLPAAKLGAVTADHLRRIFDVNVVAPVLLTSALLPQLRANAGRVVNISSDAAVEAYPGWGNYGASKAALDHVSAVLSEEEPDLRVYAVDPGDMNTAMHQAAFPGEDISDREDPAAVAATLLPLIDSTLPSGRYCAAELPAAVTS
ncbi:SDR family NAD(P)-dependent oxidoreductase [Thermocrispum municipale]|jgi:NAD(P)-dependent dehydrogenase (short-subunit alcohol dehydrogenase family)|uniref:SDR family NAD(P)-dependent oxidoreductase n=1 Tax=Thermocrispum municipale TaxID=37926 RepID=UPI0003F9D388|nr:SDR family oxidoreductase [Thermocrispum municipale]